MNVSPFPPKRSANSSNSILYKLFTIETISISGSRMRFMNPYIVTVFLLCFTFAGYAQKEKEILPLVCVKKIDEGLFQATFSYENPTKKEVVIDENGSIIKSNNGKKVAKGLNKFKPGLNKNTFTKEFGPQDFVEWSVTSNGKTHTVVANGNSAYCEPDDSFIFPVIGNGKSYDLIGQELTAFCDNVIGDTPSDLIFQLDPTGDKVLVEIVPIAGINNVITLLTGTPFSIPNTDFLLFKNDLSTDLADLTAIDVYIPTDLVCLLNNYPQWINFARPVYPAKNNNAVISQGDGAQTSNSVRESFRILNKATGEILPVDGAGITIGVLSDSYNTRVIGGGLAAADIAADELPLKDDMKIIKDNPFSARDEGRAMMQIIHDVAPGAKIQFHTAVASPRQFEVGFKALALECDIIVDDITFVTEPFFGTGHITEEAIIPFLENDGKFHFTSAGNLANKGYQSTFQTSSNVPTTNFIDANSPTRAHLFDGAGGSDYLQKISVVPGTYMIALQWKELAASQGTTGADNDLDIYIVDDLGRLLVGSNRTNVKGDPTEVIVFRASGTGEANILITSANGPATVPFRYIAFHTSADDGTPDGLKFLEHYSGAPTVSGHAMELKNYPGSVTVGAVDYRNALLLGDKTLEEEYFSSYAGLLSDGITELKIDLYAPDGGNTTTDIGILANCSTCDNDDKYNFYGTSAAAPHAAAAMALLQSALPAWFPPGPTDTGLKTRYTVANALSTFQDNVTGFTARDGSTSGLLNTLSAFKSLAAQSVNITSLKIEDGKTASAEPFILTIIGEFFPESIDDVEVSFDEKVLDDVAYTTLKDEEGKIVKDDDGNDIVVLTVTLPAFSGNPELVVNVKSKTDTGTDGKSDPVYILDGDQIALNVKVDNLEINYGQDINLTYSVEGLPLDADGVPVTFESLGLPPVKLYNAVVNGDDVPASGYPIVFDHPITPSFGKDEDGNAIVLNDEQKALYLVNFIESGIDPDTSEKTGMLTIHKNNLTIKPIPKDGGYEYGEEILFDLNYSPPTEGTTEESYSELQEAIQVTHYSDFKEGIPSKFQAFVSKFQPLVSDYDLHASLLDGGSWTASDRTIENKFQPMVSKFQPLVSDWGYIALGMENFTDYLEALGNITSGETSKFQPFVNKFQPFVNKFQPMVSAFVPADYLFNGEIVLGIEEEGVPNKFQPMVSKFQPLVSAEDDEEDSFSAFDKVFAIVDVEDSTPDGEPDADYEITKLYALNMITGLEVTPGSETHYIYPGAFLSAMSANFNITYDFGEITIKPTDLIVSIPNLTIEYGEALTKARLLEEPTDITEPKVFEGWAYGEDITTYFAEDEQPFEFVKGETTYQINELKERGEYTIKLKALDNYTIGYAEGDYGTLTIAPATLTFTPVSETINYGETPVIDPKFEGFADFNDEDTTNDETEGVLKVDGKMPYYFMNEGETRDNCTDCTEYTIGGPIKMDVGLYDIFITDDSNDDYAFSDTKVVSDTNLGTLTIAPATLTFPPVSETIDYGKIPVIDPKFDGFAYNDDVDPENDENADVLKVNSQIPYYFIKDGATYTLAQLADMNVGVYEIFITDDPNDNYVFSDTKVVSDTKLGTLTIAPAILTFTAVSETIIYGNTPNIQPEFGGFGHGELKDVLIVNSQIPYYFMKDGATFTLAQLADMNVGVYEIFITDDPNDNYVFSDTKIGALTINKATLTVTITPEELIINQGDIPDITASFGLFAYPEQDKSNVFLGGVPYEFEDENGVRFDDTSEPGVFTVRITDPTNYVIAYNNEATLFVNSNDNIRKVRTYADCVKYNESTEDYTVIFRYENDNDEVVFVAVGPDNELAGGDFEGEPPTFFMPGSGSFEIRFDGSQLTWSLTTYGSTNKSSISSLNQSGTGECDAKTDYLVYPNPVTGSTGYFMYIEQNVPEVSTVYILDMYGRVLYADDDGFDGTNNKVDIDMSDGSDYPSGMMFIVRIVSLDQVRTYNIIKQ